MNILQQIEAEQVAKVSAGKAHTLVKRDRPAMRQATAISNYNINHKSLAESGVEEVGVAIASPKQVRKEAAKAKKAAKGKAKK